MKENLYHVARLAYLCGQEDVPWHYMVRLLRQGIRYDGDSPQELRPEVFEKHPQLKELLEKMLAVTDGE